LLSPGASARGLWTGSNGSPSLYEYPRRAARFYIYTDRAELLGQTRSGCWRGRPCRLHVERIEGAGWQGGEIQGRVRRATHCGSLLLSISPEDRERLRLPASR